VKLSLRDALLRGRRRPRRYGAGSPTNYRGDGYEFVELRQYVPGDDVRRIDWAATARSGELQTRIVLEDVALTLAACLDDSASMRVGRERPLLAAAQDAVDAWFGAALSGDRLYRIASDHAADPRAPVPETFDLHRALLTARAALPRGTALLVISDFYDLDESHDELLAALAIRFDCTALVARDPWFDGLPLRGMVRLRGAEGGSLRAYVGRAERERFLRAVREREDALQLRFTVAGWRTGTLTEGGGRHDLERTFGLRSATA
jgi:uncharacterized protein (DUF58 family)